MAHKAVAAVRQARKIQSGAAADDNITRKDMAENEDKYKRMIMWSGITFFMVLIFIIWGYNLKNSFNLSISNDGERNTGDISKELDKVMETFNETTDKLGGLIADSQATSTASDEIYNMASIAELRKELESATSTVATTTVKTKIKK